MSITTVDRNTKAVWATMAASWVVAKLAVIFCAQWVWICPFITPDVTVAVTGVLASLASQFVPQSAKEILDLAAKVKIESPDVPGLEQKKKTLQ